MRKNWLQYFMDIARATASRATCDRKHVGAVIVKERSIIATGYNGSIGGTPHCDEAGHLMEDGHCVRTIHAETNALLQAARYGHAVDGATLYCTTLPCWSCYKQVSNAGILQIIYDEPYRAEEHLKRVYAHAAMTGMLIHRLDAAGTLISDHVDETFSKRVVLRKEGS